MRFPTSSPGPNGYPSDFFNAAEEPRARGIVLETDGEGLGVSADSDNPDGAPVRFGDVNPSYSDTFTTFSEERLFSPIGSNVVDLHFFVPGTDTPTVTRGFGAVYTDVDTENSAEFELFDADDQSLGRFSVPVSQDGLSFLGIAFDDPVVARVRIVYGDSALGPDDDEQHDVAVMDDFIFGEPQAIGSCATRPGDRALPSFQRAEWRSPDDGDGLTDASGPAPHQPGHTSPDRLHSIGS